MNTYDKRVPKEYYSEIANCGTIETITYPSKRYADSGEEITKKALVYLPYGFDRNAGVSYKTLYLMHGGGGNEEEFLYGQDNRKDCLHIIDHLIADGLVEPMIIVTPTFYYVPVMRAGHDISEAGQLTKAYPMEFRNDLLPYIEEHYPVLAGRENRAFGGFSMGAETTWGILTSCLDLVKNFMPLSGDCWIACEKGGLEMTEDTVELMEVKMKSLGFDWFDYNIFAFTGKQDIAFPALDAQIKCMRRHGWGLDRNAIRYCVWSEGIHWYPWIYEYVYNILPDLFL